MKGCGGASLKSRWADDRCSASGWAYAGNARRTNTAQNRNFFIRRMQIHTFK